MSEKPVVHLMLYADGKWYLETPDGRQRNHNEQLMLLAHNIRSYIQQGHSARASGMDITMEDMEIELELYSEKSRYE